jgi:hypothetical protein
MEKREGDGEQPLSFSFGRVGLATAEWAYNERMNSMHEARLMKRYLYALLFLFMVVPAAAQDYKPLVETFVSDDERLTLRYPSGWVIDAMSGQVVIASDEALFEISTEVPAGEGALGIIIFDDPTTNESLFVGEDVVSKLEYLIENLIGSSPDYVLSSDVEGLTVNDRDAAYSEGELSGNEVFVLLVDHGEDRFLFMIGLAAPGEMVRFEPKLKAIAESVNFG